MSLKLAIKEVVDLKLEGQIKVKLCFKKIEQKLSLVI